MKLFIITTCLLIASLVAGSQTCTTPGQNPATAFPVCGTSTFSQSSVPLCGGTPVPAGGCGQVTDVNPFWYKFTCFQSGTLAFKIKPHVNSEDYDWQLFDVTNQNPANVYTNPALTVSFNWSGESGETGASAAGTSLFVCDGFGKPLWSSMANLIQGHEYLLLISHFTQTQSGYDLSFGGGTAIITDTTPPRLKNAEAGCGGNTVRVKLNKKMKCSSVTSSGSDFFITPGTVAITGATAIGCSSGFDTDSIELTLASVLAPGTYTLNIKNGTDGNTLLDYCNNAIPGTDKKDFTVFPSAPTPMDSLAPVKCAPSQLRLVFPKPVLCSSVAANGSDFTVTGNYPVTITSAQGNCTSGNTLTKEIIITLSQPMYNAGNFNLTLKIGTDGNTIMDECGKQTPAGSSLSFNLKDTVNADFTYMKFYGCNRDTIQLFHPGSNGVNSWQWNLDDNLSSSLQNPQAIYSVFDEKTIRLIVGNDFCSDTATQKIMLDNFLKADFNAFDDLCPNEPTRFTSTAQGNIKSHSWTFGDGGISDEASPLHNFAGPLSTTPYIVTYTVTDSLGCTSSAQKPVKVYSSCYLTVPNAFTPNNDGRNDFLYPLNAVKAEKLDFRIYNRWGQEVFHTRNWKNGWDGTVGGTPQGAGVYVWFLSYVDRDTKESRQMKGTAVLIR